MKGIQRTTTTHSIQTITQTNIVGLMACKTIGQRINEGLVIQITLKVARLCIQAC